VAAKRKRGRHIGATILAPFLAVLAGAAFLTAGCGRKAVSREDVERIDEAFRKGSSRLSEATAFIDLLEKFDFENARFLEDLRAGINAGREACGEIGASLDELAACHYPGPLGELGGRVKEYSAALGEAVEELQGVYDGLDMIMPALEPTLREEAVITQLEAPSSDAELLERLERLDVALGSSLAVLDELETPPLLSDFREYFTQIFSVLNKVVADLIVVTRGRMPNPVMESNPDFLRLQQLMADYPALVEGMREKLKVSALDPLIEKVELEINRLYLGEVR